MRPEMLIRFAKCIGVIFVASLVAVNAQAQRPGEAAYSPTTDRVAIQSVSAVLSGSASADERLQAIESLYDKEVMPSEANLSALEQLADRGSSIQERVAAIRVYALLYSPENPPAENERLRARLRALAQSEQKSVASTAILRYSRLPYSDDTESLLDLNFSRGFLNDDDLQGELAHMFPFVPPERQIHLLERLDLGNSGYALDVLASLMKPATARSRLSSATRQKLIDVMLRHQPGFSVAIGEFSLKEAITFSDWLHVLASLYSEASISSYENVILAYLDGPAANPKRAISFFASPEGKAASGRIGYTKLKPIFEKISKYADSLPYPQHSAIRDFSLSALRLRNQIGP
jgi:hypothetical protein